jgi:hypothetical protein
MSTDGAASAGMKGTGGHSCGSKIKEMPTGCINMEERSNKNKEMHAQGW